MKQEISHGFTHPFQRQLKATTYFLVIGVTLMSLQALGGPTSEPTSSTPVSAHTPRRVYNIGNGAVGSAVGAAAQAGLAAKTAVGAAVKQGTISKQYEAGDEYYFRALF